MYRARRKRRIANYIPKTLSNPWSHETTNVSIRVTDIQNVGFIFPVDTDTGVYGSVVIPSLSAQGVRYIRNMRLKLTVIGNPTPISTLLIYCPASINPNVIGQQNQSSLYEPNQNLILHTLSPASCNYTYDDQASITGKMPFGGETLISYSKSTWKLNSDDCVKVVCSCNGGMYNSDGAPLIVIGTLDYWVRF